MQLRTILSCIFLLASVAGWASCARPAPVLVREVGVSGSAVDINSADERALERLPGIGPSTARKIVSHRARHGPFRRVEHLLLVDGISEKRFRAIRRLIAAR